MTTALAESNLVNKVFEIGYDSYVAKPINTAKMLEVLEKLGLISWFLDLKWEMIRWMIN